MMNRRPLRVVRSVFNVVTFKEPTPQIQVRRAPSKRGPMTRPEFGRVKSAQ